MEGLRLGDEFRVLLGIDGSASSFRALAYAVGAAERMKAGLLAAYVQPMLPSHMRDSRAVEDFVESQAHVADELRAEVETGCAAAGLRHVFVVRVGDPFTELRRLAIASDVDAVLIGASMQAHHRLLPSTSSRLVRAARWPITVVP